MSDAQEKILLQKKAKIPKPEEDITFLKKILYFISGIKTADIKRVDKKFVFDTSIKENPLWSNVCNVMAVASMAASGFLFAFLNKYNL